MVSTFISFGLSLLVAMQGSTTSDLGNETTAKPLGAKRAQKRSVESRDRKEATRRPPWIHLSRSTPRPPRPEGRPTLVPGGSSRKVAGEKPREQNAAPRRRVVPQIRVKVMLVDVPLPDVSKSTAGRPATGVSKGDMGEIVAELKKRGGLRVGAQLQLLCGDNQAAFIQFGSRVPRVTGTSNSSRGRTIQTTRENIGTILGVTARVIEDDLVTLEIDLERSRLGPEEEGTPVATSDDGSVGLRAPQVETLTLQTTVSLRSGQTVLLGGMVFRTGERCGERLLLLHAEIVN